MSRMKETSEQLRDELADALLKKCAELDELRFENAVMKLQLQYLYQAAKRHTAMELLMRELFGNYIEFERD